MLQPGRQRGAANACGRRLRYRWLPRHGTAHNSKPLPPFAGICLSARPLQCRPQEYRGGRPAAQGLDRDLLATTMATNANVSSRIAELTQELSADFMMADEPFAASVDFTQAGVQRHWNI